MSLLSVGFCGPYTYHHVSISSDENASPDPIIAVLDQSSGIYDFTQSRNEHWAYYTVTFGVTLDLYPDFV